MDVMSERNVARAIASLEELELIEADNFNKTSYDRTKWYTINYEACEQFLAIWREYGEPVHGSGSQARGAFLAAWQDARASAAHVEASRQTVMMDTEESSDCIMTDGHGRSRQSVMMDNDHLSWTIPVVTSGNAVETQDAPSSNSANLPSEHQPARTAPGEKKGIATTNPYLQGNVSVPTGTTALNDEKAESDISGRDLYRWLVEKTNSGRPLTKAAIKALSQKIVVYAEHGAKTEYPNLLDMYDTVPGFKLFCEESLDMFVRAGGGPEHVKAANLISFLRDLGNAKGGTASRWFTWAAKNPEQCVAAEVVSEAELEAQRAAEAVQAERDAKFAAWKVGADARDHEASTYWNVLDADRPEHLRGLHTLDEWEYYTRHNLTLAQQQELAAKGELPDVMGWS
jgi:hypothetical protein